MYKEICYSKIFFLKINKIHNDKIRIIKRTLLIFKKNLQIILARSEMMFKKRLMTTLVGTCGIKTCN